MTPLESIAFYYNESKSGAPELALELAELAKNLGKTVRSTSSLPLKEGFLDGMDACCVIGGDGTLLSLAADCAEKNIPVIGINRGSLGFLTTFSTKEALQLFPDVLKGNYSTTQRSLLKVESPSGEAFLALNDAVIRDVNTASILKLEVFSEEGWITDYLCDGIILATPTGSTAYNLSAGGPLIHPAARTLAMTPICPHTLSNRSIVFDSETKLQVRDASKTKTLQVLVDGRNQFSLKPGEKVNIKTADTTLSLIHQSNFNHFEVVRTKLKWTGSHKGNN